MSATTTIRQAGRARAQSALTRTGDRAAELSASPAARRLFLLALPRALARRFDTSRAGTLDAVVELRVRDPDGGAPVAYGITIRGGACIVTRGHAPAARAGIEIGADDIIRLVTGSVGWPQLLAQHRLELSGDPFLGLRFPVLFRLPARAAS
jgi:hypothetical protein